jgi:nucleotide-binding universal stress UspA family protein
MTSILLIAEREEPVHQAANRALMLARYLGARLDILLCDTERRHTPPHPQAHSRATAEAHQYLDSLRKSIVATDVEVTTDVDFAGPLHEQVARKVRTGHPLLVVKSADREATSRDSRLSCELICDCPAPLLLTLGRPWHPRARLAAVIDISDGHISGEPWAVAQTCARLRHACSADMDLVCAPAKSVSARQRLMNLAQDCSIEPQNVRSPDVSADESMPHFLTVQEYDLIATGVTDERRVAAFEDSVPGQLLKSVRCDLLFVKPGSYQSWTPPFPFDGTELPRGAP